MSYNFRQDYKRSNAEQNGKSNDYHPEQNYPEKFNFKLNEIVSSNIFCFQ